MSTILRRNHVFLNCPFDATYKPIFDAIVFAVRHLGFEPRCALEVDDSGEIRLTKIERIIEQCRLGIHDISNVSLDAKTGLPRFNMPLELGIFLGSKRFGNASQQNKACLILDSEPYRYRACMSDISGQDIHVHGGDPHRAISEVRDWLSAVAKMKGCPGGAAIGDQYDQFVKDAPALCADLRRKPDKLTFDDLLETVDMWLETNG